MKITNKAKLKEAVELLNDYLTIACFAEAYGVSQDFMYRAINIGRKLHNREADKLKKLV